ncbi:MAG: hypothetical protein KGZ58_01860 [Ignavibacteriales bacterium]|nr:hypothetical protein [Ignavibacteriales bacterium]
MDILKETTIATIKNLPDGCSVDDIMYEIYFVGQVVDGLKDANEGKTISTEELLDKVQQWKTN